MTLQQLALLLVVAHQAMYLYVFSFQRFTLAIGRRFAGDPHAVARVQVFLTPTLMGLAGWACSALTIVVAVFLGSAFHWTAGVAYLCFQSIVATLLFPLLQWRRHFSRLATRTLLRNRLEIGDQAIAVLMAEVARATVDRIR